MPLVNLPFETVKINNNISNITNVITTRRKTTTTWLFVWSEEIKEIILKRKYMDKKIYENWKKYYWYDWSMIINKYG